MRDYAHARGFTLIELLVVIAIIAVLAAILFPVFARAREKARQSTCSSNQRQIAASLLMYAQDHDETFPSSATMWRDINVDPGVLVCPTLGKSTSNGYGYLENCSGAALGSTTLFPDPTKAGLTADALGKLYPNIVAANNGTSDFDPRHTNSVIVSWVDGHVSAVSAAVSALGVSGLPNTSLPGGTPPGFPVTNPAALADPTTPLDSTTSGSWWVSGAGYKYGTKGYVLSYWSSADVVSLAGSYVQSATASGNNSYVWGAAPQAATKDPINPATGQRAAACWYQSTSFTINITLTSSTDATVHKAHVYMLDWDPQSRTQTLDVKKPGGASLLSAPFSITSFANGVWANFYFRGNVTLLLTQTGPSNAVVSAICFD